MRNINWDAVQERQPGDFNNPEPGGYIAIITSVTDNEEKERLEIKWDYANGDYKGYNQKTFCSSGYWPSVLFKYYTEKALSFFKAFKTAVERSNAGYAFNCSDVFGLQGKIMGVVLGEEEYLNKNGELKTSLYVYQVRSVSEIQAGNYEVPKLKKLSGNSSRQNRQQSPSASYDNAVFTPYDGDDGTLPF